MVNSWSCELFDIENGLWQLRCCCGLSTSRSCEYWFSLLGVVTHTLTNNCFFRIHNKSAMFWIHKIQSRWKYFYFKITNFFNHTDEISKFCCKKWQVLDYFGQFLSIFKSKFSKICNFYLILVVMSSKKVRKNKFSMVCLCWYLKKYWAPLWFYEVIILILRNLGQGRQCSW